MDEHTIKYLTDVLPEKADWIKGIEKQAKQGNVPIMDAVSVHFLMQLIRLHQPARILEIGTAIGYSALRMQEAYPAAKIITIERDEQHFKQAINNIEAQNKQDNIHVIFGNALDELEKLAVDNEQFDTIFIDAAKGQYKCFFDLSIPLLKDNGLIISDNVLFRGLVANPNAESRRLNKLAGKIRDYNEWLINHPGFTTSIVPIGDGVAISLKNKERGTNTNA